MKPFDDDKGYAAILCVSCLLMLLFAPFPGAWAAEKQKPRSPRDPNAMKSDSPLHIASDRMEVVQAEKIITFVGHVVIQQDDLTITGNSMKVFAASGKKEDKKEAQPAMMDQVDRIEMEGDIKISQRDKVATADKAVYYHQDRKIVLLGSPMVSQGQDSVRGRVITLYIAEGRSVVEGGDAPVQAVLHPKKKE